MEDEQGVMYKLGGIEALLKTMGEKLDKSIEDNKANHNDHEKRLSAVEKGQVKVTTVAVTLSTGCSIAIGIVGLWLKSR